MTISTTTAEASFAGNGSTTAFALGFEVNANSELVVILRSAGGVNTTQTLSTHYTISNLGAESGATVNMVTAPASGETLYAYRRTTITQEASFRPLSDAALTALADKLTKIAQENRAKGDRALVVPIGDSGQVLLPPAASRAAKTLMFDGSGNVTVGTPATVDAVLSSFMEGLLSSADAAALIDAIKEADKVVENASPGYDAVDTGGAVGVKGRWSSDADGSIRLRADPADNSGATSYIYFETDNVEQAKIGPATKNTEGQLMRWGADGLIDGYDDGFGHLGGVRIARKSGTAVAELVFNTDDGMSENVYDRYDFIISALVPANDGVPLGVLTSADGTTFSATGHQWHQRQVLLGLTSTEANTGNTSGPVNLCNFIGSGAGEFGFSGTLSVYNAHKSSVGDTVFEWRGLFTDSSNARHYVTGGCVVDTAAVCQGVRFAFGTGNIESGDILLIGQRKLA